MYSCDPKSMRILVLVCLLCSGHATLAYDSGIAIQTEKGTSMQVFVNGKLYNRQPGKFVRVRSNPGLFHLEIKVLNPYDKQWYIVRKDIRVDKGYEFHYKVVFNERRRPEVIEINKYPVFSRYFLQPTLYNTHPVS